MHISMVKKFSLSALFLTSIGTQEIIAQEAEKKSQDTLGVVNSSAPYFKKALKIGLPYLAILAYFYYTDFSIDSYFAAESKNTNTKKISAEGSTSDSTPEPKPTSNDTPENIVSKAKYLQSATKKIIEAFGLVYFTDKIKNHVKYLDKLIGNPFDFEEEKTEKTA